MSQPADWECELYSKVKPTLEEGQKTIARITDWWKSNFVNVRKPRNKRMAEDYLKNADTILEGMKVMRTRRSG